MSVQESDFDFMSALEAEYRAKTGLTDRALYKIFYSTVRQAEILVLGINPGGNPQAPETIVDLDKSKTFQDVIRGYSEHGRHDILDYDWKENRGLLKLLVPVLCQRGKIRIEVVKTNLAFRRSNNAKNAKFISDAMLEARPFLSKIIERVRPKLVLLTCNELEKFLYYYCPESKMLNVREVHHAVHQTIFWSALATMANGHTFHVVSTAHASQFSYIYSQYDVPIRIQKLISKMA